MKLNKKLQILVSRVRHFSVDAVSLGTVSLAISLTLYYAKTKSVNYLETTVRDYIFVFLILFVQALIVSVVGTFVMRRRPTYAKLLFTIIVTLLLASFAKKLIAFNSVISIFSLTSLSAPTANFVSMILLVMVFVIIAKLTANYITRHVKKYGHIAKNITMGLCIFLTVFCAPSLVNLANLVLIIKRESKVSTATLTLPNKDKLSKTVKPDIYYIVLDRYASFTSLQENFDYDNSAFTSYLEAQGFNVSKDSHSNYPYTAPSIASTLNMDYLAKYVEPYKNDAIQSRVLFHSLSKQPTVVKTLKSIGYTYHLVGTWYGASSVSPQADLSYSPFRQLWGKSGRIGAVEEGTSTVLADTPFYPALKLPEAYKYGGATLLEQDGVSHMKQQFDSLNVIASAPKPGNRFIFAHILTPHDPYYFNSDCSINVYSTPDNMGKSVKSKYLGQLECTNTLIKQLINKIKAKSSGEAIVAIVSDEGPYPHTILSTTFNNIRGADTESGADSSTTPMTSWTPEYLKLKYGNLNAVYLPNRTGADTPITSNVNLFRSIFNHAFNAQLNYLPDCYLAYGASSKDVFKHVDISPSLFNSPSNAQCGQYETIKR